MLEGIDVVLLDELIRETIDRLLEQLPVKERLEGLSVEERLEGLPIQKRLEGLSVDELLAALSPDTREDLIRLLKANGTRPIRD